LSFGIVRGEIHQDADPPDPLALLLRARRERPRRGSAKQSDELSSASASSVAGTSTPSVLAVLRLMIN
jgi:hypothetical protein